MSSLSAKAKSRLYSNLEKYAHSGMGMEKACHSLLAQPRLKHAERRIYEGLLEGLKQGQSIGAALGSVSDVVSPLEMEVVAAAEEGGMLEKGFAHLAEYFRRFDLTRRRITKGLIYPIVLLHLAIPVSTLAVAAFGSFSLDGKAPEQPFSHAFSDMGQLMLVAYLAVVLLIVVAVILHRLARRSGFVDACLRKVPLLGKARRAVAMERFSQVFEIFLLAGKKMSDSLLGAAKASGSGLLIEAGERGSKIVADGDLLASALYASPGVFPDDFVRGMVAAEEAGVMDRELAEWGRLYSEEANETMEQLGEWTPKLFYWGILLFVAFLLIRAALAYRDLIENLLNFEF
tara:strand:- start:3625 stop:4659 length:1035 start_codon:yes stop_codon:yes gene_type:complete